MTTPEHESGFGGLEVVAFESRRAVEMASLVTRHGGVAVSAPTMREVALAAAAAGSGDTPARAFARRLADGGLDAVVFMTGIGVRALAAEITDELGREAFAAALRGVVVVARGPKPVMALREIGVTSGDVVAVPPPNTQREVAASLAAAGLARPGARVAVIEHGAASSELYASIEAAGAELHAVPVYRWALVEDTTRLDAALRRIAEGHARVALFTSAAQVDLALGVAADAGVEADVRAALARGVVASIGPVCSARLRAEGLAPDVEPEHAKMGHLVKAAAERARGVLAGKA